MTYCNPVEICQYRHLMIAFESKGLKYCSCLVYRFERTILFESNESNRATIIGNDA